MLILAFDTTSEHGGVGIYRDMECWARLANQGAANYSVGLFQMVDRLLKQTELRLGDIELFAVALGPGSFTGIRVGVAAAQGWAMAFERPVVGVSMLEAMVEQAQPPDIAVPILNARRGEFFLGLFRRSPQLGSIPPENPPARRLGRPARLESSALAGKPEGFAYPADGEALVLKPSRVRFVLDHLHCDADPLQPWRAGRSVTCIVREHDAAAQSLRDCLTCPAPVPEHLATSPIPAAPPSDEATGAPCTPQTSRQWQSLQGPLVDAIGRLALRAGQEGRLQHPCQLDAYYVRRADAELNWRE